MPNKFHFISGLPRSGSTLLSSLLRQNPRFSAAVASPVASFIEGLQPNLSRGEYAAFFDDDLRKDMLRTLFDTYYRKTRENLPGDSIVFDSNRTWTGRMSLLASLYPESRVICCVREIGWIIDSMERMLAKNPTQLVRMFNFQPGSSVYARAEMLMHAESGLVGQSWATMREAWYGEQAKRLIVVRYDHLVKEPTRTLKRIYAELREPWFEHDLNNVAYDEPEYDAAIGMPGLHTVRKKVEHIDRKPILPPDLFFKYSPTQFWDKPELNTSGVVIV